MSKLVDSIVSRNFVEADSIISETVELIMVKKLEEAKKMCASKMTEQQGHVMNRTSSQLTRLGVVEEDNIEEMDLSKEKPDYASIEDQRGKGLPFFMSNVNKNSFPNSHGAPKQTKQSGGETVIKKTTMKEENLDEAQGTYRAGYKYDPVVKTSNSKGSSWSQTATKGIDDKPDHAGKQKEVRSLDNTQSSDGKTSSSTHEVIKSKVVRPDKNDGRGGDYDVSTSRTVTQRSVQEEEEQIDEARINIIKARIRGGKIQRRKKVSNVPGMTLRGGKLQRMSAAERRRRKMGARKAVRKRAPKMNRALMKRKRSLMKRRALGL